MANPLRILFVSDEVEPFSAKSITAKLSRYLPERLQESGDYEVRIMMPRYGTISERKNRLHEVIRLSGTEIDMVDRTETLKVKVASIPGIRLQVYFMDNSHYFKRKGIYANKQGQPFEDNLERALFFGRSSLETIRNLGWGPDVVHGFGWLSGFVPMLLRTEYAGDPLFENVKILYTPGDADLGATISDAFAAAFHLDADTPGLEPSQTGVSYADSAIFTAARQDAGDGFQFSEDIDVSADTLRTAYEQVMSEIAA
jgi:starch synthase